MLIACGVCSDASLLRTTINTMQRVTENLATQAVITMHIAKHCSPPGSLASQPYWAPLYKELLQWHYHPGSVTTAPTLPSAWWTCCSPSLENAAFSQALEAMSTLSIRPNFLDVSKILSKQKEMNPGENVEYKVSTEQADSVYEGKRSLILFYKSCYCPCSYMLLYPRSILSN